MTSSGGSKAPRCAWPKCNARIGPNDHLPLVGERTGRVYACAAHRPKIEITKAVVGTGLVAAFQAGMDRAAPGLRERIGTLGMAAIDVYNAARSARDTSDEEPST